MYRIRSLQRLGLRLAEIRPVLESSADDLTSMRVLLQRQLLQVREQLAQARALEHNLGNLLARIDESTMPTPEQFMSTLEMIAMLENHFTPDQLRELADKRRELGEDRIETAKRRWAALVEDGLRYVKSGTPVSDPAVRDWVRNWDEVGSLFHSGVQTQAAARSMWQENSAELSAGLPWPATDMGALIDYLARARRTPPQD